MASPLPRRTIFVVSDDNETCADELIVSLAKQGIKGTKEEGPGDGPWSVLYACTDAEMVGIQPLIMDIEAAFTEVPGNISVEDDSDDQPST